MYVCVCAWICTYIPTCSYTLTNSIQITKQCTGHAHFIHILVCELEIFRDVRHDLFSFLLDLTTDLLGYESALGTVSLYQA